jgi:hypothetical protein
MNRKRMFWIGALWLFLISAPVLAEDITIGIESVVTYVDDWQNLLEGKITVGTSIKGYYTYNTDTPNTYVGPYEGGVYLHQQSPYGIYLNGGGLTFATDQNNPYFFIEMDNNYPFSHRDDYAVMSYINLNLPNVAEAVGISWQLHDLMGTAIDSIELLPTPPILDDWNASISDLDISIGKTLIKADVTSAILIPEPMSVFLMSLGCMFVFRKRLGRS